MINLKEKVLSLTLEYRFQSLIKSCFIEIIYYPPKIYMRLPIRLILKKNIHFSSAAVLSIRKDDYAKTKLEDEQLKESGLEYCILQPSIIYDPADDKNTENLVNFAKKFSYTPILDHGKWQRQSIYIDNICYLVISMTKKSSRNEVNSINGRKAVYFRDLIKIVLNQNSVFKFMMSYQELMVENTIYTASGRITYSWRGFPKLSLVG